MNSWIIFTLILSLISPYFYTKSILSGKSKPHKITRLVVWLASVVGMLSIIGSSNMSGIIFAAIFLVRASYLLLLALSFGVGGATKLDKTCLAVGVMALLIYATTKNGLLAISFGVLSDLIGYVPTFVKTWHKPSSEDPLFFGIESLASFFGIIAIGELRIDMVFPIYFFVSGLTVVLLIYRKRLMRMIG